VCKPMVPDVTPSPLRRQIEPPPAGSDRLSRSPTRDADREHAHSGGREVAAMRISHNLLRVLILVGCLPLLAPRARLAMVRAHTQDCTSFSGPTIKNCPSGCTSQTYTDYPLIGGTGFHYADENPAPCSPPTCTQPYAFSAPHWECLTCCLDVGETCDPHECDTGDPCCDRCDTLSGVCCATACNSCFTTSDCCGNLTCPSGTCCYGRNHWCQQCSDCCGGLNCIGGVCRYIQ
jgi:hypothetical protein